MDLVVTTTHGEAEVSLLGAAPTATVGDLVRHVTGTAPPRLCVVDGRPVPSTTALGSVELLDGSTISTTDDPGDTSVDTVIELVQVAGRGTGCRVGLPAGRYVLGPGQRVNATDLELAPVHEPRLELVVTDEGTVSVSARAGRVRIDGTVVDQGGHAVSWTSGILDTTGRAFRIESPTDSGTLRRPRSTPGSPTVAFNRPPRSRSVQSATVVTPPPAGGSKRAERAASATFTAALAEAWHAELRRRRLAHPDPAAVADLARRADPTVWQRRPGDPDAYRVAVGLADQEWSPVPDASVLSPTLQMSTARFRTLPMVPVVVDLDEQVAVGVVGSPGVARSVARSLLLEAALAHGPADLDVVVATGPDRAPSWEWTKWLPHTRVNDTPSVLVTTDAVEMRMESLRADRDSTRRRTLVVVDDPLWWRDRSSPIRRTSTDPSLDVRYLVVADSAGDVPALCTTVVTVDGDGSATVDEIAEGRRHEGVHAFLTSAATATGTARALAPLDDPELPLTPEADHAVPLTSLCGPVDPTALVHQWAGVTDLRARIGEDDHGVVEVDLVGDGPHALLVAATPAELAGLVQTTVVALAAATSPEHLTLAFVADDPATFGPCIRLPHALAVAAARDRHGVERVLRSLAAEVARRREGAGAPALVVVVADIADMARDPGAAAALVDLATHGPAVGVHLVMAATHPVDLGERLLEHVPLRIMKRLPDDSGSSLGEPTLARLPTGTAVVLSSANAARTVQLPTVAGRIPLGPDGLTVRPFLVSREPSAMEHRIERTLARRAANAGDGWTDIGRLVAAIDAAAATLGTFDGHPPFVDELPDTVELRELFDAHPGDAVPYGLADLPDEQRRDCAWWSPADGPLVVYGAAGAGATSVVVAIALGLAERCSADDVHLYVLDGDPARNAALLAPLAALPHCGSVVAIDDDRHVDQLLAFLDDQVQQRARAAAAGDATRERPTIVVAIDDLAALRRATTGRHSVDGSWERVERIVRDGASVDVVALLTTSEVHAIGTLVDSVPTRLVMRLEESGRSTADHLADAGLGVNSVRVATFGPGRALRLPDHTEVQTVRPPDDLERSIADLDLEPARERPPRRVDP